MVEMYFEIKDTVIGESSYKLFQILTVMLLLTIIITYFVSIDLTAVKTGFSLSNCKRLGKIIDKYFYYIYTQYNRQVTMMVLLFLINLYAKLRGEVFISSYVNDHVFLFFSAITFINAIKIKLLSNSYAANEYRRSLMTMSEHSNLDDNTVKNNRELECNRMAHYCKSTIRIIELKLDILKHFVGPILISLLLSFLDIFEPSYLIQELILVVSTVFICLISLMFWYYFKLLAQNYKNCEEYESLLYRFRNKIEFTPEELENRRTKIYGIKYRY